MQTGMLWINQPAAPWVELPFGGVKDSGYGSEGGPEALEAYLNDQDRCDDQRVTQPHPREATAFDVPGSAPGTLENLQALGYSGHDADPGGQPAGGAAPART
jgi:hypothetical protein